VIRSIEGGREGVWIKEEKTVRGMGGKGKEGEATVSQNISIKRARKTAHASTGPKAFLSWHWRRMLILNENWLNGIQDRGEVEGGGCGDRIYTQRRKFLTQERIPGGGACGRSELKSMLLTSQRQLRHRNLRKLLAALKGISQNFLTLQTLMRE